MMFDDDTMQHSFGESVPEDVIVVPAVTGHGNHGSKPYAQRVEDLSCCIYPNLQGAMAQSNELDGLDLCSAFQRFKTLNITRAMLSLIYINVYK